MRQAKIILWVLILTLYAPSLPAQKLSSLYNTLDSVMSKAEIYQKAVSNRISKLERQLKNWKNPTLKYDFAMQLFLENRAFDNEAAIKYIDQCIDIAREIKPGGDKSKIYLAQALLA